MLPLSTPKKLARRSFEYLRELVLYLRHLIKGTSYAEYYADRMNRIVTRNPSWGLNLNKRFQLDYLQRCGMQPASTLLDYGCGAMAAGIHFIGFLDVGKYVGVDISSGVLQEGMRRLQQSGLARQEAQLKHLEGGLAAVVGDRKFDFIWAQSVLTHMPPDDILALLIEIRRHMHRQSQFFATFARTNSKPIQKQFKDWYYSREFFNSAADNLGLNVEFMADWTHPEDLTGLDTMARFTLKEGH